MFMEPERTAYDLHFRLFGIPVRVHPWFWIVTLLLGITGSEVDPLDMLLWVVAVFVSIVIHELGHAFAARAFGWQPWITLYSFGGLASYQPYGETPRKSILVSLAGPGAGFAFAAVIVAGILLSGHRVGFEPSLMPIRFEPYTSYPLTMLLYQLLFINFVWGLVNLLPIFPLDGGRVSREVFQSFNAYDGLRQSLILSIIAAGGVAIYALLNGGGLYVTLMFAYLGYLSYTALQSSGRGW